jgi:hypothetical protein
MTAPAIINQDRHDENAAQKLKTPTESRLTQTPGKTQKVSVDLRR